MDKKTKKRKRKEGKKIFFVKCQSPLFPILSSNGQIRMQERKPYYTIPISLLFPSYCNAKCSFSFFSMGSQVYYLLPGTFFLERIYELSKSSFFFFYFFVTFSSSSLLVSKKMEGLIVRFFLSQYIKVIFCELSIRFVFLFFITFLL